MRRRLTAPPQHLAGELFKKMAGVNLLHVPYRGGAPAIQRHRRRKLRHLFGNMPEFLGQIGGKNLIPSPSARRWQSPMFPDLPLISQFLPGYTVVNWFAVFGPRGLPADFTELWNKTLRAVVAKPDVQKRFLENGMDTVIGSPAELKATIAADRKKWADGDPGSRIRRLAIAARHDGQAACSTRSSIRRAVGVSAASAIFHHGIGRMRRSGPGGFPALAEAHRWSLSTCAAMAARTSLRPTRLVARPCTCGRRSVCRRRRGGLQRFHLVLVIRIDRRHVRSCRCAGGLADSPTLTVSNGAISAPRSRGSRRGRRQLDAGGVKAGPTPFCATASTMTPCRPTAGLVRQAAREVPPSSISMH